MGKRRGHGESHIRKRPNGLWEMQVDLGRDRNGDRVRKSVYGRTKSELHKKRRRLEETHGVAVSVGSRIRFAELAERWIKQHKGKATTLSGYRHKLETYINPVLGQLFVEKMQAEHIDDVLSQMDGLSGSSRAEALTIMRGVLELAVRWKHCLHNVAKDVSRPRVTRSDIQPLTVAQCKLFLEHAAADRLYGYFVVAIMTGLRQSELCGLQWSDVDLKAKTLVVNRRQLEVDGVFDVDTPKTGSSRRVVTLPAMAVDALISHKARMMAAGTLHSEWVFHDSNGGPLRRQNVKRRHFDVILKSAGLPHVRFHDIRHTAATVLLQMGENPKVVQERLGHSRVSTTLDVYSHVMPGMQEQAASKLDELLG